MSTLTDLSDWLDEQTQPSVVWYLKRLSSNDTLATAHQSGPYIPKELLFRVFPSMNRPKDKNPECFFELCIDSHADIRNVRAVWYNNKLHDGTRDETRLTRFGGSSSPFLDPENIGALVVFAFRQVDSGVSTCRAWVCEHGTEEDLVEDRVGPVDPGKWKVWDISKGMQDVISVSQRISPCWLAAHEIPEDWFEKFPNSAEIVRKTVEFCSDRGESADLRLMRRRECEFDIFRSVEQAVEWPIIQKGFTTLDEFIDRAQRILQRRKSRSGRSLELHALEIFIEENLCEGRDFSYQAESEQNKRPDFIFPSEKAYKDMSFPEECLRMLAVKTTCRDRWRQVINEAERIKRKHL
ncbi:MAG: type II restriction endonuclease, partial [Zoogloeaceae bacterium]|nr:type II restriction endonuclease [Zoogloeaceae bacterium]